MGATHLMGYANASPILQPESRIRYHFMSEESIRE